LPVLTRCLTLSLGKEIKAVSALEKKADNTRQTAKTIKYQLSMFPICYPTEYPAGPFNIIIALAIHRVKETNAARRSTFSPLPPGGSGDLTLTIRNVKGQKLKCQMKIETLFFAL